MTPASELNKVTFSINCDSLITILDDKTLNTKSLEAELKKTIQESLSKSGVRANTDSLGVVVKRVEPIS